MKKQNNLEKTNEKKYNKIRKVILPELPEVKERTKKTYLITFLMIFIILYTGILELILNTLRITNLTVEIKIILNIVLDVIAVLICGIVLKNNIKRDIKYYLKNRKNYIDFELTIWGFFIILSMISNIILRIVVGEEAANETMVSNLPIIMKIVSGIFIGPIIEELMFRGLLRKVFKNKFVFVVMSSLIFGALHVLPVLTSPIQLVYLIPYVLAGVELGFIYVKTDNIFASTTLHMFSNALGFILL